MEQKSRADLPQLPSNPPFCNSPCSSHGQHGEAQGSQPGPAPLCLLITAIVVFLLTVFAIPSPTLANSPVIWEVDEVRVPVYHSEVIVIEPQLRHFETRAELVRWLDSKPIILISGGDCDDFAMALIEEAAEDGYYMFFYPDIYNRHFKCCVIAGNNVYLVEPQSHEIELVMRVD